jgi:hypothetical protein
MGFKLAPVHLALLIELEPLLSKRRLQLAPGLKADLEARAAQA